MSPAHGAAARLHHLLHRNLIFVHGKGGVGKTVVSQSIALSLSEMRKRTLWVEFENPFRPAGEVRHLSPTLSHLNAEATTAFEEYAAMKIGTAALTRIFLQNKLMRYLSKAAPGIHELVLLGKVWHERLKYDHVVVDMPSTGYGLAMFQSTKNFEQLFTGGPIHRDAQAMLGTFRDPNLASQLIVALPEEMPLRESIELQDFLLKLFPENRPGFLVNRKFPEITGDPTQALENPDRWPTPVPWSALDYARKRSVLEAFNLRIWRGEKIEFGELDYVVPRSGTAETVRELANQLRGRDYL